MNNKYRDEPRWNEILVVVGMLVLVVGGGIAYFERSNQQLYMQGNNICEQHHMSFMDFEPMGAAGTTHHIARCLTTDGTIRYFDINDG